LVEYKFNFFRFKIVGLIRITSNNAIHLAKYFGNSAKFWLSLQDDFDLETESIQKKNDLKKIKPIEGNTDLQSI
jgi:plasmid maintenance system antidote protein VapI